MEQFLLVPTNLHDACSKSKYIRFGPRAHKVMDLNTHGASAEAHLDPMVLLISSAVPASHYILYVVSEDHR